MLVTNPVSVRSLHGTYQDKVFTAQARQGYMAKHSIRAFQNGVFEDLSKAEYSSAMGCLPIRSIPEKACALDSFALDCKVLFLASLAGGSICIFNVTTPNSMCELGGKLA